MEKAFHTRVFFFFCVIFFYTSRKHYIAMNEDLNQSLTTVTRRVSVRFDASQHFTLQPEAVTLNVYHHSEQKRKPA